LEKIRWYTYKKNCYTCVIPVIEEAFNCEISEFCWEILKNEFNINTGENTTLKYAFKIKKYLISSIKKYSVGKSIIHFY